MDELIKLVTTKTGISEAQAKQAVDTVIGFLKQKLPAPLGGQIDALLSGKGLPSDLTKGLGELFGKK